MNPLVFPFASGWSFFLGGAAMLLAIALGTKSPRRARQLAFFGIGAGVLLSATPIPWRQLVLLALTTAWWWREPGRTQARVAAAASWIVVLFLEIPSLLMPPFALPAKAAVGVVGDSLTTGLDETNATPWPALLKERHGLDIHSAAWPGANCVSALKQAEKLGDAPNVVIVEIGGNDLFNGMWQADGAAAYERNYDALLAKLARPGRRLIGVELPLPPWCPHWGAAQRRVAAKHQLALIPKWRLLAILCTAGTTVDGIHPSKAGQERLAALFGEALGLPPR